MIRWVVIAGWAFAVACGSSAPPPRTASPVPEETPEPTTECAVPGPRYSIAQVWIEGDATLVLDPDDIVTEPPRLEWSGDLDGDGRTDAVVAFQDCTSQGMCRFGVFVQCEDGTFAAALPPDTVAEGVRPVPSESGWASLLVDRQQDAMPIADVWGFEGDAYHLSEQRHVAGPNSTNEASVHVRRTAAWRPRDGDAPVHELAISRDGETGLVIGATPHAFATDDGRDLRRFRHAAQSGTFDADGALALLADEAGHVRAFGLDDGEERWELAAHEGRCSSVVLSQDGRRFATTGTFDRRVVVWDVASRDAVREEVVAHQPHRVGLDADGTRLAVTTVQGDLMVWTEDGMLSFDSIDGEHVAMHTPRFFSDGATVRTGNMNGDTQLFLVDAAHTSAVGRARGEQVGVHAYAISPAGNVVVRCAQTCFVEEVALPSSAAMASLMEGEGAREPIDAVVTRRTLLEEAWSPREHGHPTAAAFAPGGRAFYVGTDEGWVLRYQIGSGEPVR